MIIWTRFAKVESVKSPTEGWLFGAGLSVKRSKPSAGNLKENSQLKSQSSTLLCKLFAAERKHFFFSRVETFERLGENNVYNWQGRIQGVKRSFAQEGEMFSEFIPEIFENIVEHSQDNS